MTIRRATAADIPQIDELLRQVLEVHHAGRPDLFKGGVKKYTDEELKAILANDQTPVFVAVAPSANDGNDAEHNADSPATDQVLGYAFCVFQQHLNSNILTDIKTLYIDDLCVDERSRGHHVGSTLYRYVLDFARQSGCHNVTLNVWGLQPQSPSLLRTHGTHSILHRHGAGAVAPPFQQHDDGDDRSEAA